VVRFAYEVAEVDAVLFVVAEMSLPELEGLVASNDVEGDCAAEGVGEKEGRRERRMRKRV
jgi:hypothetical protein